MAAATTEAEASTVTGGIHDPYLWHKLHSLSGLLPLGVFLVQHLIANSYALLGVGPYDTVIKVYGYLPFVAVLEITVIYLPLLYHAGYGFYIAAYGRSNVAAYPNARNWLYFLQRVSGVIAFFYIGYHLYNTSLQKYILLWHGDPHPERSIQYVAMAGHLASTWVLLIYVVGIVATVFHFSNGMWNFCIRWGLTISQRSQRASGYVWAVFFVLFTAMAVWTVFSLHAYGISHPLPVTAS